MTLTLRNEYGHPVAEAEVLHRWTTPHGFDLAVYRDPTTQVPAVAEVTTGQQVIAAPAPWLIDELVLAAEVVIEHHVEVVRARIAVIRRRMEHLEEVLA